HGAPRRSKGRDRGAATRRGHRLRRSGRRGLVGKNRPGRNGSELIMPRTDAAKAEIPGTDMATTGAGKFAVIRRIVLAAGAAASALRAGVSLRRQRPQSPPLPAAAPEAADVLAEHHEAFDGLYEPLYQALRSDHEDQLRQVLNEWEIGARHADDSRL